MPSSRKTVIILLMISDMNLSRNTDFLSLSQEDKMMSVLDDIHTEYSNHISSQSHSSEKIQSLHARVSKGKRRDHAFMESATDSCSYQAMISLLLSIDARSSLLPYGRIGVQNEYLWSFIPEIRSTHSER